jgi:serine/threonine protein kinase
MAQILGDRYEIQQELSKKAGRRTLLARDINTEELVTIKLLTFSSDFNWDDLKLFEREAETLKSLSHPAIPRYLDYFDVNLPNYTGFALVQTYIPARSLEQYIQTGRTFTEIEVTEIARSILEILIYLHGLNPPVIHRDIKPSNILLGERSGNSVGKVYLIDFGSVQTAIAPVGATRTVVGTYGYMAQEQFGGRSVPASDLYSLGATIIHLITGTHPADLPQKDLRIQFTQFAQISPHLTKWLIQMTEPGLDKRMISANAALQALTNRQELNSAVSSINQPSGSKIRLQKQADFLEISIPSGGLTPSLVYLGGFALAWNSFILFWTASTFMVPFPGNIFFLLFSTPFWIAGFGMIYQILTSFSTIWLKLDNQQISYYRQLWGMKISGLTSGLNKISKLVYTAPHYAKDSEGAMIPVPSKLTIWIGVKKIELEHQKGIASEAELAWLAQELSSWLDLPIESAVFLK